MNRTKVSAHFYLDELVHPDFLERFGPGARYFLAPSLVASLEAVRLFVGVPLVVNNYATGGPRKDSGLRVAGSVGAQWSRHKMGLAADFIIPSKDRDFLRGVWEAIALDPLRFGVAELEAAEATLPGGWVHIAAGFGPFRVVKP